MNLSLTFLLWVYVSVTADGHNIIPHILSPNLMTSIHKEARFDTFYLQI